jgi:hypothetical protein
MKTRKLLTGEIAREFDKTVTLQIKTRCPAKWKLTDLETGEEYMGYDTKGEYYWKPINAAKDSDA